MSLPPALLHELSEIFGPERTVTDLEQRLCYAFDATNRPVLPDVVLFPAVETEVVKTLRLAAAEKVPVTVRGAGVGFSGGAVPARGGIVLCMTRMNRILEIDADNLVAVVEPGVVTQDLQDAVAPLGLFYPPDPASVRSSTLGGNVAECAGGLSAVKYGVTKHYVLGMRFVLADGTVCEVGGKTVKNVTGYDLIGLLVGSEGTLAVMTRFTLKLLPLPETRRTLLVGFGSAGRAGEAVSAIIRSRVIPTALEIMDRACMDRVGEFKDYRFPEGINAVLLLEIDGDPNDVDRRIRQVHEIIVAQSGNIILESRVPEERERVWDVRRAVSPAIARLADTKINEDVSVPRSRIPELFSEVEAIRVKYGLMIVCFGHAGDGNIHVNLMIHRHDADEVERAERAVRELLAATVRLGGAISGEHGIGLSKREYLSLNLSPEVIELSRAVKRAFDPAGILNPDKIFPLEPERAG
ncbi:MAG: FAD-binding protein [Acidobacteria bacterium]|nr:FAD-binding protein [Acidobacteriota bacterium]